jgi:protoporphyrinogen oxidase
MTVEQERRLVQTAKRNKPGNDGGHEDVRSGLAGLSSGYVLTKAGFNVNVYERDAAVGGLSKTIEKNDFRFDLGGHRFFSKDAEIETFVRDLMGSELVSVRRSSKIYMRNKYFDYPLKPLNAVSGLGIPTTVKILEYLSNQ